MWGFFSLDIDLNDQPSSSHYLSYWDKAINDHIKRKINGVLWMKSRGVETTERISAWSNAFPVRGAQSCFFFHLTMHGNNKKNILRTPDGAASFKRKNVQRAGVCLRTSSCSPPKGRHTHSAKKKKKEKQYSLDATQRHNKTVQLIPASSDTNTVTGK